MQLSTKTVSLTLTLLIFGITHSEGLKAV